MRDCQDEQKSASHGGGGGQRSRSEEGKAAGAAYYTCSSLVQGGTPRACVEKKQTRNSRTEWSEGREIDQVKIALTKIRQKKKKKEENK